MSMEVSKETIEQAYARISAFIHETPVFTSSTLDELLGKRLYFKCENFQKTGSFKSRGALNHVKCLLEHFDDKKCESTAQARRETCERLAKENKYIIVDPHNDAHVMCGQGTIALEFLEQVPDIEAIIVSVGGGGLAAGVSKYAKSKNPKIKVFCAEPEGKHLEKQLVSKTREICTDSGLLNTIADGIRVKNIGDKCFPILVECCEPLVFSLAEDEIRAATKLIWQRLKVVVEPSAALPLAAVMKYSEELKNYTKIGLILCGGNMNHDHMF
ncbi:pyridoxal-phosphate dependent enzyme domain-containing protein [Ditylenchus destructor]|uniref:L-serine ammonia-lyase n=1 Tax=Ditylenchus destructor TaxID=166010 RepID=A0AAD4NKP9_9BILA|nr:pyridoxal-phosphate dependent enzyme domain-containing protein [Ditylenchus destructor]